MADNPRIEDLRRRVQKDPASIAFAQLAEEYRRAGQHQEAIDTCLAGLERHPGYLSARVTLGRALIEVGRLEEAQGELERVLKSASENLAAIRGLAEIHRARGSNNDALTYFKAALALARNDPDLEEIVADLTKQVIPQKRKDPEDGLSFDEMQEELTRRANTLPNLSASSVRSTAAEPSTVPVPPTTSVLESASESSPDADSHADARNRAGRTVAALEQWLDAIHVARTESGS